MKKDLFDVIIIGGSYAGLSAAMALGRSLRHTLVIDSGSPCNRQTPHSHNFLTQDGRAPAQISAVGRQQVEKYDTVSFHEGEAIAAEQDSAGFVVTTKSGERFFSKKIILASGIKDQMPDIPGFESCWGISVIHCPYCHGYEVRGKRTGLFASGERAMHMAGLINNLTKNLTVLTSGKAEFSSQELSKLNKYDIPVITAKIEEIIHENGRLTQVNLKDGTHLQVDALYAAIPFVQNFNFSESFNCELTDQGFIKIDASHKTSVAGVFACGDNSSPMRSVANSVAAGNLTGAMVNMELTQENFT